MSKKKNKIEVTVVLESDTRSSHFNYAVVRGHHKHLPNVSNYVHSIIAACQSRSDAENICRLINESEYLEPDILGCFTAPIFKIERE